MLLATIIELFGAGASLIGSGFGAAYLLRPKPVPKPHLTEYRPEDRPMLVQTRRYEFTDEHGVGLGELVPRGEDPFTAAQDRGIRDGKSYGARAVQP